MFRQERQLGKSGTAEITIQMMETEEDRNMIHMVEATEPHTGLNKYVNEVVKKIMRIVEFSMMTYWRRGSFH